MEKPIDPSVLGAMARLTGVTVDADFSASALASFKEGDDSTRDVGHLLTQLVSGDLLTGVLFALGAGSIEIYLSRSGTKLLQRVEDKKREYARLKSTDSRFVALFCEIGPRPGSDAPTDLISGRVFEVVVRPFDEAIPPQAVEDFLKFTPHITRRLPPILDIDESAYKLLLRDRVLDPLSRILNLDEVLIGVATYTLDFLGPKMNGLAETLENHSKMPGELWNPKKRTEGHNKFIEDLGSKIESLIKTGLDEVTKQELDLVTLIERFPGADRVPTLIDFVKKIETLWNAPLRFVEQVAEDLKELMGTPSDSINALLGYVSGLWDAIMDAVIGMLQIAGLALRLVSAFLRANKNTRRATALLLEAFDEIYVALTSVDWFKLWNYLKKKAFPKVVNFIEAKAQTLLDDATRSPATAGYYLGYLVYNVAETFFPPLKLSKVSKGLRAAETSRFLAKLFAP